MIRLFIVAVLVFYAGMAFSHSFYPRDCCSDADCKPIDAKRVQITPAGYMVDGRTVIPYSQTRWSPDEHYHACFPPAMLGNVGCFWAPQRSM